ncbi:trypsin-like peptidase domain-containing protein [Flavobacterium sp.]|uniref:trypsin-like peptidase domain-containing protein n=1 Tax=Flavobacterium sp. TaxID=239 RepID=UPI003B9A7942
MKKYASLFFLALSSGAITLGAYKLLFEDNRTASIVTSAPANYLRNASLGAENIDFTTAADQAVHCVVHVKNVSYRTISNPIMEFFYGYRGGQQQEQIGTGSGVIISEDGYIVTNNHVIKDASELEITLNNNETYKAKVIGTDSKMDIALLKIDAKDKLPYATFADSDAVKVGEWVLAVGNPYNLNSTVTAGIVSAKARNLGNNGIQSFIQTDAAVNPGNSGGALVNTRGELIGINTMISSQTGAYVGYSFAVPSNITRKIIEDIMEYGNVQRGILGIECGELNATVSKELGISQTSGVYISSVNKNTGAEKAGLKKGDIIVKLDDRKIQTYADLAGFINAKRPNDEVKVTFLRDEKTYTANVKLTKYDMIVADFKGLELENLSAAERKKLKVNYGVRVKSVENSKLAEFANDLEGGVILKIGNVPAENIETVSQLVSKIDENQAVQVEMITKNGELIRFIL